MGSTDEKRVVITQQFNREGLLDFILQQSLGVSLTQNELNHLFDIYKEVAGSTEIRYPLLDDVLMSLGRDFRYEYRAGSRWSGHSKFTLGFHSGIKFEPNYDPKNEAEKAEIKRTVNSFDERIQEYLEKLKQK